MASSQNLRGADLPDRSWAQVTEDPNKKKPLQKRDWFQPEMAIVKPHELNHSPNHLLGVPQEIRDVILELLRPDEDVVGSRPKTGYESYQLVCRQIYHETSRRWNYQPTALVPSNRSGEFIKRTLDITVLHSNAYSNVKVLFFEIHHDAPSNVFCQLAQVLRLSTQLEELHLFGIGPDGYGHKTSSVEHACGKHDTSILGTTQKLQPEGQKFVHRLTIINSIIRLEHLRVLVLDNLNMPLLQAHVLRNKPRLEKLYIAADPRSMLHQQYRNCPQMNLGNLIFPVREDLPPVRELHINSNAIFSASSITGKIARTLEVLDWVIPDVKHQQYVQSISFYNEAAILLSQLHLSGRQLREFRICVHGPMSEDHWQFANLMGGLKNCLSRMPCLQLVEVHMQLRSAWFASEFIQALPPSVTRLYLTDLIVDRQVLNLSRPVGAKTNTPPVYAIDSGTYEIGEDLGRKDFIEFSLSKLAFVGYEFGIAVDKPIGECIREDADEATVACAEYHAQKDAAMFLLKFNARLLEKERNRHLAYLKGKFIPLKEAVVEDQESDGEEGSDDLEAPATHKETDRIREGWKECALGDDHEYFGEECAAEAIFRHEPVAKGGSYSYSYPVIAEVDDHYKFSSHWLSK